MFEPSNRYIRGIVAGLVGVLAGCAQLGATPKVGGGLSAQQRSAFPPGFLWGVSTAGYQWEGYDSDSQWAHWDRAERTKERNPRGADGLNRFEEDIALTASMGCNTFRTSFEWARIEPEEGKRDPRAIAYYHKMLDAIRKRGMTPIVTLHHFSHPAWFERKGGWEHPEADQMFARHAAFIASEFGAELRYYLTFNEPNVYVAGGYLAGVTPPGKRDPVVALKVAYAMIRAHKLAYVALHRDDPDALVSTNWYTAEWVLTPKPPAEPPEAQAIHSDRWMMDQLVNPSSEAGVQGGKTMDFVAMDYYTRLSLGEVVNLPSPEKWQVYPTGFYKAIKRLYRNYRLPVLIAENGMATRDHAQRGDRWTRATYLMAHVREMQRAIQEGIPVFGYVHWSITDNYEWGSFSPRFGLYRVECRDGEFTRIPTDGVNAYRSVIRAGGVTDELSKRYRVPATNTSALGVLQWSGLVGGQPTFD
jgi:beta-glucosidase